MKKETFMKILDTKPERLSLADIEAIMNEELEKDPAEMDTNLVDRCLDALTEKGSSQPILKVRKSYASRIAIAVAVFALVVLFSFPAGAKLFQANVPEGIVEFYNSCFNVDVSKNENVDDIEAILRKENIDSPILPGIIYVQGTEISDYSTETISKDLIVKFDFKGDGANGTIVLQKHKGNSASQLKDANNSSKVESILVGRVQTTIFENDDCITIAYSMDNIEYNVNLFDCSFDTACEIAKTL